MKTQLLRALSLVLSLVLLTAALAACGQQGPILSANWRQDFSPYLTLDAAALKSHTADLGAYLTREKINYADCYGLALLDRYKETLFWETVNEAATFGELPEEVLQAEKDLLTAMARRAYETTGTERDFETFAVEYYGYKEKYSSFNAYADATVRETVRDYILTFYLASAWGLLPTEADVQKKVTEFYKEQTAGGEATRAEVEEYYAELYGAGYVYNSLFQVMTREKLREHVLQSWSFTLPSIAEADIQVFDKSNIHPNDYERTEEKTNLVEVVVKSADSMVKGSIYIRLYPESAPKTVAHFQDLVGKQYYRDLTFYRVIPKTLVQAGDARGSQAKVDGEFFSNGVRNQLSHTRGVVSLMHGDGPNTGAGQFFILQSDEWSSTFDGSYAAFGYVVCGLDIVNRIGTMPVDSNGTPTTAIRIENVYFVTPKAAE